jgi:class 3 adenylate cyclase
VLPDEVAKLAKTRGESCQVLVIFLDIRGFSKFAGVAESSDTAIYLRDMYARVLTDYFSAFTYAKPTGDGLMIIYELAAEVSEVESVMRSSFERAVQLVRDFPTLTDSNVLITIPVPARIGIGIARGSATRIITDDEVVFDYSGRCLNLAARLMDLARPQGVVLSDKHAVALLGSEIAAQLDSDAVYIKGVSDDETVSVLYTPDWVAIPDQAHAPIAYKPSFDETTLIEARVIREVDHYLIKCFREPRSGADLSVTAEWEVFREDGSSAGRLRSRRLPATRREEPDGTYAGVSWKVLRDSLDTCHVPDDFRVSFTPHH